MYICRVKKFIVGICCFLKNTYVDFQTVGTQTMESVGKLYKCKSPTDLKQLTGITFDLKLYSAWHLYEG